MKNIAKTVSILTLLCASLPNTLMAASNKDVSCVQSAFYELGYDIGAVDGLFGKKTQEASKLFLEEKPGFPLSVLTKQNADEWCVKLTPSSPPGMTTDGSFFKQGKWTGTWHSGKYSGPINYHVSQYTVRVSVNNGEYNWTFKGIEVLEDGTVKLVNKFPTGVRIDMVRQNTTYTDVIDVTYVFNDEAERTAQLRFVQP